ncbi:hypothetical protein G3I76_35880, partial [Streptomyces sp. SID11233]|nr:hypothetical protein [Streptomyces sp. SID11233]
MPRPSSRPALAALLALCAALLLTVLPAGGAFASGPRHPGPSRFVVSERQFARM